MTLGNSCLPCGLIPLRRLPGADQPLIPEVPTSEFWCPLSVSHALEALIRSAPAGLVSCRSRPWGFPLQGRSHSQSETPSQAPLPSCGLQVTRSTTSDHLQRKDTSGTHLTSAQTNIKEVALPSTRTHFRVSIPASVRAHAAALWATEKLATLMGFILHRGFPLRARDPPEAYPLMSLTNGAQAKPLSALQSLADEEIGLTPSSLPPLPRFSHLIDKPRSSQR